MGAERFKGKDYVVQCHHLKRDLRDKKRHNSLYLDLSTSSARYSL